MIHTDTYLCVYVYDMRWCYVQVYDSRSRGPEQKQLGLSLPLPLSLSLFHSLPRFFSIPPLFFESRVLVLEDEPPQISNPKNPSLFLTSDVFLLTPLFFTPSPRLMIRFSLHRESVHTERSRKTNHQKECVSELLSQVIVTHPRFPRVSTPQIFKPKQ